MKKSRINNLFIPDDWDEVRFRQIFGLGKGLSITKDDLAEEGIPVISYGQIHAKTNSGTGLSDDLYRFIPESYLINRRSCLVNRNDFIFADTSEDYVGIGNCVFIDRDETIFAGYHSIIARPIQHNIYPKYFAYLFLSDCWRDQIRANVMGIKVFSITQHLLRSTYVILPPIEEQQAIATLLDIECAKIDSLISDLEKQIEILQKYKKSLITETVTKGLDKSVPMKDSGVEWIGAIPEHWEIKRLKYLGTARNGLTFDPVDMSDDENGTIVLRSSNIQNDSLSLDDTVYVTTHIPQEIRLKENDILLCSRNGSRELIGKCIIIEKNMENQTYGAFMCVYRSPYNRFLHYIFLSEMFNYYLPTFLTSTVNQLTNQNLGNIIVPITYNLNEQRKIVEFLDEECRNIDGILKAKNEELKKIKDFKSSLIFEYVTGKKRVKEAM